jgi:TatD DNase family protein
MTLYDTHAHLCDSSFDHDLPEVLDRARDAGVAAIVAVGETLGEARRNLELSTSYPDLIFPAAGLFPTILDLDQAQQLADLIRRERRHLVGIGEVGLDHWKVESEEDRDLQREIFALFIDLSLELDLPLNVHSRSAGRKTIELLLERGAKKVQLHAFDGKAAKALPGVEAGFYFSVPPSVARSTQKQKLVHRLPLSCLLLETDSPVLGEVRDQRNEPANVGVGLEAICQIKNLSADEVVAAITENTKSLYGEFAGCS